MHRCLTLLFAVDSQTNNVGAAIWAANLAKEMQIAAEQQQQSGVGGAEAGKVAPAPTTV